MKSALKIILIQLLILNFVGINYSQISEKELINAARNYIKSDKLFVNNKIGSKSTIKTISDNKKQTLAYVIELQPEGFLVLSPSKDFYPVVAYSDLGTFDFTPNEYNGMLTLIQTDLGCRLETLNMHNFSSEQLQIIKDNRKAWDELINNKIQKAKYDYYYGPNLPDVWGGVNCVDNNSNFVYVGNYYTPNHFSPGCVATSLSQILHMFEWPSVGQGEHTNYDTQGSSQGTYYSAFGRMWYDWGNMLDEYYGLPSADAERRAMGALAYQCGTALDMEYENDGSTSNVNKTPAALNNYFRACGHYETGSWDSFWPRLRSNLENGYAVQMAISDQSKLVGHAMVCDGWRQVIGEDKYYHMNNGWWGTCNAWYRLQVSFSDCGYDAVDGAVFDILPDPMFVDEVIWDADDTKTFTIRWNVSKTLNWDAFELQEDKDNSGTWTTLSNTIADTFYVRTVPSEGVYKYRVRAKSSGNYYSDSYSEILRVPVEKIVYLNFDGDDSYFLNDNREPEYANVTDRLDISDNWTIETWVEVDTYTSGDWNVILDRKSVFSMYLIDDEDGGGDFAIRFAARDVSGAIIASLQSDVLSDNNFAEWIHVAITRDGTSTKMFINGTKVDESTDTNFSLTATTNALNIGARYWTDYERYLDGRIDELRISDVARYETDFCPDRFYRFNNDENTRVLLHMDAFIGDEIKEYSYNFVNPTLRAATNNPSWASSSCPIITTEPEDVSICEGGTSFSISAVQIVSCQWQEDSGSGFVNLTDGGVYSGATTTTLNISDVTGLNGNMYRCIITGSSLNLTRDCSKYALLTVYPTCTTWDGSAWSNGEPNLTMSATIAGNYTLPYDISAKKLTILSPYDVIVPPNLTLTVQEYFENHGTITLQSNTDNIPTGALTLHGAQNNFGTMIAKRFISVLEPGIWGNWHLVSLPFNDSPLISELFTETYHIYKNIEASYSWQLISGSENLPENEGFLVQLENTGQTIQHSGEFGNGIYSETLPLTSGTNLGWKLMKNYYPSPIDWNATTGWTKNNINSTVYTFDSENNGGSNQYSAWDGTVGTYSGSRYINGFQGYFVQAFSDGAVIATDNNVRVKNSDVAGNFLKNNVNDIVKLNVKSPENRCDEIIIYSGEDESTGNNIKPIDLSAPDLFISDIENKYVIQRFKESEVNQIFKIGLESEITGTYEFTIGELNKTNYNIYIKDNLENKVYELDENFVLTFNHIEGEFSNRFEIIFSKNPLNINDNKSDFKIFSERNSIYIIRNNNNKSAINIYSIDGKIIKIINSFDKNIKITGFETGVYIVKVKEENKRPDFKKVFVIK